MGPRRLDQSLPSSDVARLGDLSLTSCLTSRAFGRYQAENATCNRPCLDSIAVAIAKAAPVKHLRGRSHPQLRVRDI